MIRLGTFLLLLAIFGGCSDTSQSTTATATATSGPAVIIASNYPLYYFAQRLADDNFDVQLPMPPEGDPAFWQPEEAAIIAMQRADALLLNGATYEKWLTGVSLPASVMINTSYSFAAEYLKLDIKHTHSHGEVGEHAHAGTAFTTWLDMTKAEAQAQAIAEAFVQLRPDAQAGIETRLKGLIQDLRELDQALHEATPQSDGLHVLASHPVYNYLAKRYGLLLSSFLWEPQTMPTTQEWQDFELRTDPSVQWMIYEDDPHPDIRAELLNRGVKVCVFRPCGNRPPSGDFLSEMKANIERLSAIYTQ